MEKAWLPSRPEINIFEKSVANILGKVREPCFLVVDGDRGMKVYSCEILAIPYLTMKGLMLGKDFTKV